MTLNIDNKIITKRQKNCPFCAEEILEVAVKCKYCKSDLDISSPEKDIANKELFESVPPPLDLGIALIAIPIGIGLLLKYWVGGMNLLQSPSSTYELLSISVLIGTAILIAMEVSNIPDRERVTTSPIIWFLGVIFLWVIVYPFYLYKRGSYGYEGMATTGILVTVFFLFHAFTVGNIILEKENNLLNVIETERELEYMSASRGSQMPRKKQVNSLASNRLEALLRNFATDSGLVNKNQLSIPAHGVREQIEPMRNEVQRQMYGY